MRSRRGIIVAVLIVAHSAFMQSEALLRASGLNHRGGVDMNKIKDLMMNLGF